jgi:hypothetical protein
VLGIGGIFTGKLNLGISGISGTPYLISARTETHYYELSQAVFKDFLKLLPVEFKLTKEI